MTEHTPGPWEVYAHPISSADAAKAELVFQVDNTEPLTSHLYLINANGKCPALTGCGPASEANARLIAAAPELLEAAAAGLVAVLGDIEEREAELIERGDDPDGEPMLRAFRERGQLIQAAIAKATGAT